jgi:hypothetical protein
MRRDMERWLDNVLKDGIEYEIVGLLEERFIRKWVMRVFPPDGKVYYYLIFVWSGGEGEEQFVEVEVFSKRRKRKGGYPTPSLVEEFIAREIAEGSLFYLNLLRKRRPDERVGGKTLKDWYEDFLKFFEAVQGKSIVWHTHDEIQQALYSIEIPKDEWPDYWALTVWERAELMRRFEVFVSAIWKLIWALIEKVALRLEKQQGKIMFSLQDVVEALERQKPMKTIQNIQNMLKLGNMDKEQREWVSSIIWQKLLEASKEDKELTLYDIDVYLGLEEDTEE